MVDTTCLDEVHTQYETLPAEGLKFAYRWTNNNPDNVSKHYSCRRYSSIFARHSFFSGKDSCRRKS